MAAQPMTNSDRLARLLELIDVHLAEAPDDLIDNSKRIANLTTAVRNLDGFVNAELVKEAQETAQGAINARAMTLGELDSLRRGVNAVRAAITEVGPEYSAALFEGDRVEPLRIALQDLFTICPEVIEG